MISRMTPTSNHSEDGLPMPGPPAIALSSTGSSSTSLDRLDDSAVKSERVAIESEIDAGLVPGPDIGAKTARMQLDLHVSRFDWAGGAKGIGPGIADLAQRAEAIGVRALSFMDHYFQMDWMAPAEHPMLEGYTALGFIAGRTDRLRLRLLVTGVTYRHPGLLAKIVTTLDVVSSGRAELGIGAAWYEREHRGLGVPFPPTSERFERLEEALQICLQMWSDDNGPYHGRQAAVS